MLARKGHDVVLFEREHFPREHIGESLLPASLPILEALGAREAVERAGFLKKWGATMVWGKSDDPWSWYFRETNPRYPHSYQVWRPEFDSLLLDNSRRHGVEVCEGHRVTDVVFDGGRATAVRVQREDGSGRAEAADFIVDASGQAALIGRARDLRRWDPYFRNMAVYGYFAGAARLDPPDETNILVESYPSGWFWTIPLHTGVASVGAVVDRDVAAERVRGGGLAEFLMAELAMAPRTSSLLRQARLVKGPVSIRDWSYVSESVVGDGFVLVGDAACFVDPLFSSGVHLALSAGVLGAAYVSTALKDAKLAAAAGPVFQELYYTQYERFHEMAKLFYSSNRTTESYFWEARRILGEDGEVYTPRQDFIRAVAGQPPQGYERAVLAQGELPGVFVDGVRQVEDELAAREARLAAGGDALLRAVPRLAPDARIASRPVLGSDEFEWGWVLTSSTRPEGVACSQLVADLLRRVDGRRSVDQLVRSISASYGPDVRPKIKENVVFAVRTLYVEGAIHDLAGL
jgi:clorobiocin biosynthesis protein Clo-hal/halogenation protein CepH